MAGMEPDEEAKVDARTRAWRTFETALVVALVLVAPSLLASIGEADTISEVDWLDALDRAGLVLLVGALMSGLSWARRRVGR